MQCSAELFFFFRQSQILGLGWVLFFICAITKASAHSIVSWESAPKNKATSIVLSILKDEIESHWSEFALSPGMFYFSSAWHNDLISTQCTLHRYVIFFALSLSLPHYLCIIRLLNWGIAIGHQICGSFYTTTNKKLNSKITTQRQLKMLYTSTIQAHFVCFHFHMYDMLGNRITFNRIPIKIKWIDFPSLSRSFDDRTISVMTKKDKNGKKKIQITTLDFE